MKKTLIAWVLVLMTITVEDSQPNPIFITQLQTEFLNGVYDAHRSGNSIREDGCLYFEGGFQSAMDYLNSKIGATYNDDYTLQISLFRSR